MDPGLLGPSYQALCSQTSHNKRAVEVAFKLVDIFLLPGEPAILRSGNGSEITASVITDLKLVRPKLVLVHGKPRHPQSQGSVDREMVI